MPSLYFRVPSTTLMRPIPHLMASVDSSKASFSAQQQHVEESGGGCGESQEEVGESEEGVEGTGAVELMRRRRRRRRWWRVARGGRTKPVSEVEGVFKAVEPFDATGKGIR
jgi:hypothetical protein